MAKKITHEKTCPACNGTGKSYGPRYCRRCHGRTTVRETITIEDAGAKSATQFEREIAAALDDLGDGMRRALKDALREQEDSDV
jgi:cytochrome c553